MLHIICNIIFDKYTCYLYTYTLYMVLLSDGHMAPSRSIEYSKGPQYINQGLCQN